MKLTERQFAIYRFIVSYVKQHVYSPTVREIGEAVGLKSTSSVVFNLAALEKNGLIEMSGREPRAIKILGYSVVGNEVLAGLEKEW